MCDTKYLDSVYVLLIYIELSFRGILCIQFHTSWLAAQVCFATTLRATDRADSQICQPYWNVKYNVNDIRMNQSHTIHVR